MVPMKRFVSMIVLLCLLFSVSVSSAQAPFDDRLKEICNQVVLAIYNAVLSHKGRYKDLEDFDRQVLKENQYGIYSIDYRHTAVVGPYKDKPFMFGVTIVRPEDTNFHEFGKQAFDFGFPLLDLKFAGYENIYWRSHQFSIQSVIQENGDPLLEEQQRYLPLKLSLRTVKEQYHVREDIDFIVTLENISSTNLWVRDLDAETLYFLYDNAQWGAGESATKREERIKRLILRPGEKISKQFRGSGFSAPQEFDIYGSYIITFEGVKPSSILKVRVIK